MGNKQNSLMCAECTAIQVEDTTIENQRSNFQMTRLRHFSHYSRDFQVEQKYNRIKQNRPNFQIQVEIIYPLNLESYRDDLILKCGKINPNKKIDLNADTIKKSFQVGNLKLTTQIKSQTIESIEDECNQDHKKLVERAQQIDTFLIFVDNKTDFAQIQRIIELINKNCKVDALIFLIAAKQSPSVSFIDPQNNKDSQVYENNGVTQEAPKEFKNEQVEAIEMNEQKQMKSKINNSSSFNSFTQQDQTGRKPETLQNSAKILMESNWNTDFVQIDFESIENMNQKLENILSQCIYSQDSQIRSTQI